MRIFVTGASGWIGSATVRELVAAGHQVTGLARSEASARTVSELGAEVVRGSLEDLDGLQAGARGADAVVHLGYHHDFSQMPEAAALDRAAIDAFGAILAENGGALLMASGVAGLAQGRVAVESDAADASSHPRSGNGAAALAWAEHGVKPVIARFPPSVHGTGDHGFVATLVEVARTRGVAAYVGDGSNRWPAVHVRDAAALLRRSVENPGAASVLHAVAEEGIATRQIAEAIGRGLGLPTTSLPAADAAEHFGWIGDFFSWDVPASGALTQERFGWTPSNPGLVADIDAGHYTG